MSVRILTGWTDAEWNAEVARHREATFFHTRQWTRICLASFPRLRDRSLWLEVTTDAGSSRHQLALLERRRLGGLLAVVQSTYPHLYGGPLPAQGAGGRSVLPEILAFLGEGRGTLIITENPLAGRPFDIADRSGGGRGRPFPVPEHPREGSRSPGPPPPSGSAPTEGAASGFSPKDLAGLRAEGWETQSLRTHLRMLPATEDEFWSAELSGARRNDVRRMERKGVVITESREPADVARFHALYRGSFERWGRRPAIFHPAAYYQNLVSLGGEHVRLSLARHDGAVIGGALHVRFGRTTHYLAGYYDAGARTLRPNVLLQVAALGAAIHDGFAFYDFLPSGGNPNIERFKEGFGGVPTPVPVYVRPSTGHRLLTRARRRWTILGVARHHGPAARPTADRQDPPARVAGGRHERPEASGR